MKIRAVAAASALLLSATIPSAASAGSRSGDYVAVRAIGGISTVDGITENQSGPVTRSNTDDVVAGLGVALGYDWSAKGFPVRTEIAYHYRFRFDFDLRIDDGVSGDGFENNLSTQAVLVSLFYDFDLGPRWKPFVGLGVGWARNTSDVRRTPLIAGTSEDREDTSDNFAWTAGFGITYRWSDSWRLELAYRYIDLGAIEMGPFSNGTVIEAEDYVSHDLIVGTRFRF